MCSCCQSASTRVVAVVCQSRGGSGRNHHIQVLVPNISGSNVSYLEQHSFIMFSHRHIITVASHGGRKAPAVTVYGNCYSQLISSSTTYAVSRPRRASTLPKLNPRPPPQPKINPEILDADHALRVVPMQMRSIPPLCQGIRSENLQDNVET
jgi:hypothetical protein